MSSTSSISSSLASATTASTSTNISSILAAATGSTTAGIDVSAAVSSALYADRAIERVWQGEQTTLTSQQTALTSIQTATQSLATDLTSLNSLSGPLSARTVTSSYNSAVTATATNGTTIGNHTVVVNNLAQTASWYSDLATSATATLPQSSFTITTASGSSATINIGSNGVNTLNDVASSINTQDLGLTASVVNDSSGSRLAIVSSGAGSANDFSITSAPTTGTSWSSPTLTSGETLGADSFTIEINGTTSTINTTNGETLSSLASDINGQSLGVTASVVSDSSGSHISVVSSDGSTPFTISEPSFSFSQAVQGENASISVDGIPVSSASNTVTGAISGVTLNLLSPTSGTAVNLAVSSNTSQISTAVNQFVSDYNNALSLVNTQFQYSSSTSSEGVLGSDPTVRALQQTLQQVLNYVNKPSSGTTAVSTLGSLGITAGSDGTLSVDSTTLDNLLQNDPSDVQGFFQGSALNGFASSASSQLDLYTEAGNSAFTVDLSSISSSYSSLTTQINDYESIYIANQQTLLTTMYSNAEEALQQLPMQMKQLEAELGNNSSS